MSTRRRSSSTLKMMNTKQAAPIFSGSQVRSRSARAEIRTSCGELTEGRNGRVALRCRRPGRLQGRPVPRRWPPLPPASSGCLPSPRVLRGRRLRSAVSGGRSNCAGQGAPRSMRGRSSHVTHVTGAYGVASDGARCAPPLTCEPRRPLRTAIRAGQSLPSPRAAPQHRPTVQAKINCFDRL